MRSLAAGLGIASIVVVGACAKQLPPPGELVVAVTTDVSIPKDIDTIRMQVLSNGESLYDTSFAIFPGEDGVKMPATLAIVAGSNPNAQVIVRVIAIGHRKALVLREATAQVPSDRTALLQLPLQWLSYGSAVDSDPLTPSTADPTVDPIAEANCGANETEVAGHCESDVVDTLKLLTFDPGLVFGGGTANGGGKCFDTIGCFPTATASKIDMSDCTVPMPADGAASKINVAFVPGSGIGICAPKETGKCFVPLDQNASDGWTMKGERIQLPLGFCDKVKKGLDATVTVSTGCASKKAGDPTCGPWSAENGETADAGTVDATADGGSVEPGDSSTVPDAGTCGSGDSAEAGACNGIANVASLVTPTCAPGTPPSMTGGTIGDGIYAKISETDYGCMDAGATRVANAQTLQIAGGCLQGVQSTDGESGAILPDGSTGPIGTDGGTTDTVTYSLATQANRITLTPTCPSDATGQTAGTYTATAKTLTIVTQALGMTFVEVYSNQ